MKPRRDRRARPGSRPALAGLLLLPLAGIAGCCSACGVAEGAPTPAPEQRQQAHDPALPTAPTPERYAALHHAAADPADPGWDAALQQLEACGDGFTLDRLKAVDRARLSPTAQARLERALATIGARWNALDPDAFRAVMPVLLERAAWVDLQCDPLEATLPAWARRTIGMRLAEPGVREAVVSLRDGYASTEAEDHVGFGTLTERVRRYAAAILQDGGTR